MLACYYNALQPNINYVLNINDTYHYYNLPNLIPIFIKNLSENVWNKTFPSLFLSMFCLQLKKTKKTDIIFCKQEQAAMINVLHGTLLGLYPYNIKHHKFETRCKIAGKLREVLTQDSYSQFLEENDALIQLCTIEYLSNVIIDFCPVEECLLLKNCQLRFNLNQLFESFRKHIDSCIDSLHFFQIISQKATLVLPTIFRQLKLHSYRLPKKNFNFKINIKLQQLLEQNDYFEKIMSNLRVYANVDNLVAQAKIIFPDFSFDYLRVVEYLWKYVNINTLPQLIIDKQKQNLGKSAACKHVQNSLTKLFVCIPCALKTKNSVFNQKFAYNCVEDSLHCATCSKKVVYIDLLGRIVTIRDYTYCLCSNCLHVKIWDGKSIWNCNTCTPDESRNPLQSCIACPHRKVFEYVHNVVDMERIKLCSLPLCFQHSKQLPICTNSAYDLKMILKELVSYVNEK